MADMEGEEEEEEEEEDERSVNTSLSSVTAAVGVWRRGGEDEWKDTMMSILDVSGVERESAESRVVVITLITASARLWIVVPREHAFLSCAGVKLWASCDVGDAGEPATEATSDETRGRRRRRPSTRP